VIIEQTNVVADLLPSSEATLEHVLVADHTLRIAVASSNGERVDCHFGQTDDLWVFDVTASAHKLIEVRNIDANALGDEDRRQTIYRLVADCKVLLIARIGAAPQANLASLGVDGTDKYANASVDAALRDVYYDKKYGPQKSTSTCKGSSRCKN
jgi:lactoylglutathione lyase